MEHSGVGRDWRERPRAWCRWDPLWGLALCLSLLGCGEAWSAEPSDVPPSARSCGEEAWREAPAAEVTFAGPRGFVIIVDPRDTAQLYAAGESILGAHDAGAGVRILRIEPGRIQVRDRRAGTAVWLTPGDPVPGVPDRFVAGTTILSGLNYHYRVAERSPGPEPRLICVLAGHAHLEVTVPRPSQARQLPAEGKAEATRAETVAPLGDVPVQNRGAAAQVVEVAPHTYQVGAKDLQELLDQGARLVSEAWVGGWLSVPTPGREPQAIESPVADGTLGPRGFHLTSAKWAEAAGLETGDLILAVDGRAVNTFDDLYQAYQQVHRAARRPRFEVTLERDGVQVTKTYLIQ